MASMMYVRGLIASLAALLFLVVSVEPSSRFGVMFSDTAEAARSVPKERRQRSTAKKPVPAPETPAETGPAAPIGPVIPPAGQSPVPPAQIPLLPPEGVEADVSARSIAVTFGFTGTEIIVFGTVDNSRQPSDESDYYDIVVVVEGTPETIISRRKSNVAGLWMNTASLTFDRVPGFYAIASTRPVERIADPQILGEHGIGFQNIKFRPRVAPVPNVSDEEIAAFQSAVVRLKQNEGLYVREDEDVLFIGRSLFRSSIELPANMPVGPLDTRVYLFRQGKLIDTYNSRIMLEREGAERWLHGFAMEQPLFYGIFVVAAALSAGLLASAIFARGA
jgi:uncharacterized protein (TIGR02186 family)